ncbi:MAG: hypothetical protein JWN40_4206 [Phycisphaerales bacterium]|nr:hypothetical protein [Phycisphaerales bacterium]
MKRSAIILRGLLLGLLLFSRAVTAAQEKAAAPRVDVILWFDTEDYLLPADDDAAKRLAEMLSARDIRATFKVVGEKARVLEQRGRTDAIAALQKHDIAYHSNFHSVHPTPTEYLAECGLLDGIAEFVRREGAGASDVRRIFNVESLSCYGQPGSSWGSQAIAALPLIGVKSSAGPDGVPCYLDSGSHVGLNGKPFWFANALVVYNLKPNETRFDLHVPQALEAGKKNVSQIADRLRGEGGGLISIFYHPCEWVHKEFWDGVNFRRGANPPRSEWKAPPQRPAEETDAAFARFGQYVDHIKSLPGVHFITARELPGRYPDRVRNIGATREDLAEIALRLAADKSEGVNYVVVDGKSYSPADQFALLTQAVGEAMAGREVKFPLAVAALLGPDGQPPASAEEERLIDGPALAMAVADVRSFIKTEGRIPARVFIGPDAVPPADFLVALARAWNARDAEGHIAAGQNVRLGRNVELLTARRIAKDTPGLFGGWIIHKEGFRAPKVLEVARWQAWTLKPALLGGRGE